MIQRKHPVATQFFAEGDQCRVGIIHRDVAVLFHQDRYSLEARRRRRNQKECASQQELDADLLRRPLRPHEIKRFGKYSLGGAILPLHSSSTATQSACRRSLRSTRATNAPGIQQQFIRHGASAGSGVPHAADPDRAPALNTAQEIAHALDRADVRLRIEELLQRQAHHVRPLALQAFGRAIELVGQLSWQSQCQLRILCDIPPLHCIVMQSAYRREILQGHRHDSGNLLISMSSMKLACRFIGRKLRLIQAEARPEVAAISCVLRRRSHRTLAQEGPVSGPAIIDRSGEMQMSGTLEFAARWLIVEI